MNVLNMCKLTYKYSPPYSLSEILIIKEKNFVPITRERKREMTLY
jgi:hypothetical protein